MEKAFFAQDDNENKTNFNNFLFNSQQSNIGKLFLCESREDNSTRLFIHTFSWFKNALTKDGWWNIFSITKTPTKKGFYICKLTKTKIDKNEYLNFIMEPVKYLGEFVNEESPAWDVFFKTGKFARDYYSVHYTIRFNTDNLFKLYEKELDEFLQKGLGKEESSYIMFYQFFLNKFLADEISLKEIEKALNEKYDIEKLAEDIISALKGKNSKFEEYPLLLKKIPKDNFQDCYTTENVISYLQRKSYEYDSLNLGTENNILKRTESVLQYWDDFHKAQKAAKKARKNNK